MSDDPTPPVVEPLTATKRSLPANDTLMEDAGQVRYFSLCVCVLFCAD